MALLVQKYGGTSVGDLERIRNVARRTLAAQREGNEVVVVVSAMSGETNRLLRLTTDIAKKPSQREQDVIASTGEQVTIGLLALAIQDLGGAARSFLGHQVRITTDSTFANARIKSIDDTKLRESLKRGEIAVVAGFQGQDDDGSITTLGRGGSDTTAVAIAAGLHADVCEIYTDVDGVYTTDPNVVPTVSYGEPVPGNAKLTAGDRAARIALFHAPYWEAVRRDVTARLHDHGRVLHFSSHTFDPALDPANRTFEVGVLYDPQHAFESQLAEQLMFQLRAAGVDVRANQPYTGVGPAICTAFRIELGAPYAGIQLETSHAVTHQPDGCARIAAAIAPFLAAL